MWRRSFCRVIDTNGRIVCFQKAGLYELPRVISGARFLCPGNNAGQVWYYPGLGLGNWQWSTLRDGHSNFNACYEFQRPSITEVSEVKIR